MRDANPIGQLKNWFSVDQANSNGHDWQAAWRQRGTIELFSDRPDVTSADWAHGFDVNHVFESSPFAASDLPAEEVEDCSLTDLVATMLERMKDDEDWSLLWLHSESLLKCWDAPRGLFPIDDLEQDDEEPSEDVELLSHSDDEPGASVDSVLPIFPTVVPPEIELDGSEHPDMITSWMRTYGAQIQLIDILVGVIHDAAQRCDATIMLVGSRGFPLGQQRKIGVIDRSLVSADLHVPLIVAPAAPMRQPQLISDQVVPKSLLRLAHLEPGEELLTPEQWNESDDDTVVVSRNRDSKATAVTTPDWFLSIDSHGQPKLFLKPDDASDFNDVSRLRMDLVDRLTDVADEVTAYADKE